MNHTPSHHHFYGYLINHSQYWVVNMTLFYPQTMGDPGDPGACFSMFFSNFRAQISSLYRHLKQNTLVFHLFSPSFPSVFPKCSICFSQVFHHFSSLFPSFPSVFPKWSICFSQVFHHFSSLFPESVWAKGSSNSCVCHLRLSYIFTSSHLHTHIFTLTHTHTHLYIFTYSHLLFLSLALTSSHTHIFSLSLSSFLSPFSLSFLSPFSLSRLLYLSLFRPRVVPARSHETSILSHEMRVNAQKLR